MTLGELDILHRAHGLFAGEAQPRRVDAAADHHERLLERAENAGGMPTAYHRSVVARRAELTAARRVDAELSAILTRAHRDHAEAHRQTRAVLDAARTDAASRPDNPIAHRELMRRRIARLRAQHGHVLAARRRARRRRAALLVLRYLLLRRRHSLPSTRAALAVRAALSRLGRPYVWGATGPDRFDCSGLVKWAYAQAGVRLDRTTYDQINDGVPVPRSQIRPGDLVFPHPGHVQIAIGDNLVVEAPHAGATVRISRLGTAVAIRRPL